MEKLIVANWKMNPHSPEAAIRLAKSVERAAKSGRGIKIVVAPPFPYVPVIKPILRKAKLGAQDLFWEEGGARTGEVSGHQLKHFGVRYVIIGHSERRALGETDDVINKKLKAGLTQGFKVILCVGERWSVRKVGKAKNFIKNQLLKDLKGIYNSKFKIYNSLIVAYEPVWAIGSGRNDDPNDAGKMIDFIKKFLIVSYGFQKIKVLYGGSVNHKNAGEFIKQSAINGLLVGGASTKPKEFRKLIEMVKKQVDKK
jgi:triosephosphate isomerase